MKSLFERFILFLIVLSKITKYSKVVRMRLFEIILLVFLFIYSIKFIWKTKIDTKQNLLLNGGISALAIFDLLLHILFEGLRWQLFLIYVPVTLFIIWEVIFLIKDYSHQEIELKPVKSTLRNFISISGIIIIIIMIGGSLFFNSLFPVIKLPNPTGSYSIGTTTFELNNNNQPEIFTQSLTDTRRFMIRSWYPVDEVGNKQPVPYVDNPNAFGKGVEKSYGFPSFVVSHFPLTPTHSFRDVPISVAKDKFPVLVFSHGYGGLDFQNTVLLEELSSYGYIVFSINHAYESTVSVFPDKTVILESVKDESHNINSSLSMWANDTIFLLDQLEISNNNKIPNIFWNKLDLTKIGLLGHSFGGTTSEEVCITDDRISCGISLDSPHIGHSLTMNITKPFMLMFGQDYGNEELNDTVFLNAENKTFGLFVEGAYHYNFADLNIWAPFLQSIGYVGPINGYRMLKIINNYITAFFNEFLLESESILLDGPSTDFPEVLFYSRN